jgi:hypothetical protein
MLSQRRAACSTAVGAPAVIRPAQRCSGSPAAVRAVRSEPIRQLDRHRQLLRALPHSGGALVLAVTHLAAGELPEARELLRIGPLRREHAVAVEDRDRDDDRQLSPRR